MILGIDLGSRIGWVLGNTVGPLRRGTFALEDTTDLGLWLRSSDELWSKLFGLQGESRVTGVAVESPWLGDNAKPPRKLFALLGHMHWWARMVGDIPSSRILEVPVSTGKLTLSGYGLADKDRMIQAAAERGYPDMDEHQADALGIWWVYQFGAQEPIKRKTKSSKGTIITP